MKNSLPQQLLIMVATLMLSSAAVADIPQAGFSIAFQSVESDLSILTTSVPPAGTLNITTVASAQSDKGTLARTANQWTWVAPAEPGLAKITFSQGSDEITLNVLILTPFANGEQDHLNGYRIGEYSKSLFRGLNSYRAPRGFINIAHGPADLKISPHFTLGQFICKQQPGHDPSYLLIRPALLIKLEKLLAAANERGWEADSFHVMSGFRTPHYNASIGNHTTSSRHLYGGAADIWIDNDGDGQMDDLNGDGLINKADARELARLAETLATGNNSDWPPGGIGIYGSNSAHGPFVHIDARGYRARWD